MVQTNMTWADACERIAELHAAGGDRVKAREAYLEAREVLIKEDFARSRSRERDERLARVDQALAEIDASPRLDVTSSAP